MEGCLCKMEKEDDEIPTFLASSCSDMKTSVNSLDGFDLVLRRPYAFLQNKNWKTI